MLLEYNCKQILDNFSSTCRFCLSQENSVPILNDGQIADQLQLATEFILAKVDESDGLPNSICQRCLKCVVEFAELEARCHQTYAILNQILDEQSEGEDVQTVEHVHETPSPVICIEDDQPEQEQEQELDSNLEVLEEEEPDLNAKPVTVLTTSSHGKAQQCPICGKIVNHLRKHMPIHSSIKLHACPHCPKRFRHDTTLKQHINSVHLRLKQFHCPVEGCTASFTDRSSLRYHATTKHRNARDYVCQECGKEYHTSTGLYQHVRLTHEQKKFGCKTCGKMFAMNYHLKAHMLTHSDDRPFSCNLCDRSFKYMKNLTEHLVVRHGQPKKQRGQSNE